MRTEFTTAIVALLATFFFFFFVKNRFFFLFKTNAERRQIRLTCSGISGAMGAPGRSTHMKRQHWSFFPPSRCVRRMAQKRITTSSTMSVSQSIVTSTRECQRAVRRFNFSKEHSHTLTTILYFFLSNRIIGLNWTHHWKSEVERESRMAKKNNNKTFTQLEKFTFLPWGKHFQ